MNSAFPLFLDEIVTRNPFTDEVYRRDYEVTIQFSTQVGNEITQKISGTCTLEDYLAMRRPEATPIH